MKYLKKIKYIILTLRPHQWIKNILVFAALFFSLSILEMNLVIRCILGFIAFCAISSSVYIINDLIDINKDRLHPSKQYRPIPSGKINISEAIILSLLLLLGSVLISLVFVNLSFLWVILAYFVMNLLYSTMLKRIVILDIMIIAIGFLMRAYAGAVAIEVSASPWLFITTLMVSLFFIAGKRRSEILLLEDNSLQHRKVLEHYSLEMIEQILSITLATSIVTYSLYTLAPETIERFKTQSLYLTIPVVIYTMLRYNYLLHQKVKEDDPVLIILKDKHILISFIIWLLILAAILYNEFDIIAILKS